MTVVELPPQLAPRVDDLAVASRVTRDPGGGAVVWLSGEHDLTTRRQLRDVLAFEFSVDDSDVIVDLSDVTFMDCSTVGVLIGGKSGWPRSNDGCRYGRRRDAHVDCWICPG